MDIFNQLIDSQYFIIYRNFIGIYYFNLISFTQGMSGANNHVS